MYRTTLSRWRLATFAALPLISFAAACSVVLDRDATQCVTRDDCVAAGFGNTPVCEQGVCVATNLGPEGCYLGTPSTPEQFANQCTNAQCEPFDNCARLGLCGSGAVPPPPIDPPTVDAGTPPDQMFPTQLCVEDAARTIVVTGSSAVSGFLRTAAPLLASSGYRIAYQPSGSCNGVDNIFNADPNRRLAKNRAGTTSLLFPTDGGAGVPCSWGDDGAPVDVGVSDVFAPTCNAAYAPNARIAEYLGPVQPMTFVVPATSDQTVISAEMGRVVFGRGPTEDRAAPWTDPALRFVRDASSGTQQMLSRAIGLDAAKWWGKNARGTSGVLGGLTSVAPALANAVIGILSTDALKDEATRRNVRVLAFQASGQLCGFYPDRIPASLDKQNVRDGHYPIWGPVHFFTAISGGVPSAKAAALVQRFSLPGIDQVVLDAVIAGGLVPQCAMKVTRESEMGPLEPYAPPFQCGCYFESKLANDSVPPGCTACASTNDCPAEAPACNLGFCEAR